MRSEKLDLEIIFDWSESEDLNSNSSISGIVKITPKVNVTIDNIYGHFYLELRGKMSPQSSTIDNVTILNYSKELSKDREYNFPFTIKMRDEIASYQGANATIKHKFEVEVKIHTDDYDKIKPGILSNLKKLITNDSSVKVSRYFNYERKFSTYSLETRRMEMTRNFEYELAFVFAAIFGVIALVFIPDFRTLYVVIAVASSALLGFIFQLFYLEYTRLDIEIELINNEDNTFTLKPILSDNRYDYGLKFYYGIYEEVVDNRGTSSVTHESRIYLSGHKTMSASIKQNDIIFDFPDRKNLGTTSLTNFKLYWVVFASRKDVFGLEADYEVEVHASMGL